MLACIMVLNQLGKEGLSLKQAADALRVYHGTGEINFRVADKAAMMQRVQEAFPDGEVDHLDGVTVTYPDWWVNVRPSNTEPYLRLCLEANTEDLMVEKRDLLIEMLGEPVGGHQQ